MSLVSYLTMLFYPGGGFASDFPIPISLHGSNQEPPLFADAAATVRLENPVTSNQFGEVRFFAAPGHYMAELAGEMFYVPLDPERTEPVWQDLIVHTQDVESSVWIVNHHFGTRPVVDIIIDGVADTQATVTHPDGERTVITFGSPTVGTAQLRR